MNGQSPPPNTMRSVARMATPHASRYLQQLCKHFAHKIPATFDEKTGQVDFPFGTCMLEAGDGVLKLSLSSPDEAQLTQLEGVVERHLLRFAFREDLTVDWSR